MDYVDHSFILARWAWKNLVARSFMKEKAVIGENEAELLLDDAETRSGID